jgi:hypothetical protein
VGYQFCSCLSVVAQLKLDCCADTVDSGASFLLETSGIAVATSSN